MQIHWHGRNGYRGRDKGILTVILRPRISARPAGVGLYGNKEDGTKAQEEKVLKLLPGINGDVSPADWEEAKKQAVVQHYISEGCLEAIDAENLMALTPEKAKRLIVETIDKTLLAKWRAADNRDAVHAAIDAHLAELNPKTAKKVEKASAAA